MSIMKTQNYCISIDWLQVCCYASDLCKLTESIYFVAREGCPFIITDTNTLTRSFSKLYHVLYRHGSDWHKCAEIQAIPRSGILDKRLVLVKLDNRYLYHEGAIKMLYDVCSLFSLEIKGLSRLDLCYDCNYFHGGLNPAELIQDFVSYDLGDERYLHKERTHKYTVTGERSAKAVSKFQYIRFGSRKSPVTTYIYDKSLELWEVKDKPWIRETWERNGLVNSDTVHVWRSEISIKADGKDLLNMGTGELFRLSPRYLEAQEQIEKLFHFYAAKCLSFTRQGTAKRVRDFEKVVLFENSPEITCKPIKVCNNADTGKTERMCANVLDKLSCRYSDLSAEYTSALQRCIEFLGSVSGLKGAILRTQKNVHGLESFLGQKWYGCETVDYFALVDTLSNIRYNFADKAKFRNPVGEIHISETQDSLDLYYQYLEWIQTRNE